MTPIEIASHADDICSVYALSRKLREQPAGLAHPTMCDLIADAYRAQTSSEAFRNLSGVADIRCRAAFVCGLAGRLVHETYLHANQRKINSKPLVEHQLTLAKLASLSSQEAVLCLCLLSILRTDGSDLECAEICRASLQISALALELGAGAAFVQRQGTFPTQQILLEHVYALSTSARAIHA